MKNLKYKLTEEAKSDIKKILLRSRKNFGKIAQIRYQLLIEQAIEDICVDPYRIGTKKRDDLFLSLITYHISFSRYRSSHEGRVV